MRFGKGYWKTFAGGIEREWVITNGAGGYCGSSIIGANTRKHHGLLIASLHAPVQRFMILSKIDETVSIGENVYSLSATQRPSGYEEGQKHLQTFIYDELPQYRYQIEEMFITKTPAFEREKNTITIGYEIVNGSKPSEITFTPLFNFREHGEKSEKADLKFETFTDGNVITLVHEGHKEYPVKFCFSEGEIRQRTEKYDEEMEYQTEINTGNTAIDNHFKPYDITVKVKPYEIKRISFICSLENEYCMDAFENIRKERERVKLLKQNAGYEDEFVQMLVQAADQFIVKRESTGFKTVLAGLPWFTDWGRDTMIALQGLTLVTKRFEDARGILQTFAKYVKNGLVPNMFPDEGIEPLYNTVDASLWYFYSVYKYLEYTGGESDYEFIRTEIYPKLKEIISSYRDGTDFSIYMDEDGLIHAGSGYDQVTWMDVRVGEWVVTPRHGKPVEINALWYNALKVMEELSERFGESGTEYGELAEKSKESFRKKFWNEDKQCLYDVADVSGNDDKIRPNQIWAVSLPYTMLDSEKEKKVVETVISKLYASYGLRSLSADDAEYKGEYKGRLHDRDAAYHQGTVWAFPLGALITAYAKVNGSSRKSIEYTGKLIEPLKDHLMDGCIGSIAEIFDGNEPVISRGCYAQAWSVGEILRAYVENYLIPMKNMED
ncbi:MAG: glycogen debranching protein [Lachnospiraceae bacterium]|nr:glycogen debranching protein [Lachnospiraceae bacterium]